MIYPMSRLPMNRAAAAQGGEALFEKREVDPDEYNFSGRRTGTLRSARRAYALGARAYSEASHLHSRKKLSTAANATFPLSIYTGDVLVDGEYPLAALSVGNATNNDSHQVILKRLSGVYSIRLRSQDGGGAALTSAGFTITARTRLHLVWRIDTTAKTMALTVGGDASGTDSLNYAALVGAFSNSYYLSILGGDSWTSKVAADPPRVDNLSFIASYYATPNDLLGTRGIGSPALIFRLDQGGDAVQSTGSDTGNWLFRHPASPAIIGGQLRLGGRSGAFRIAHNPELEEFWSTELRSVADTNFSFLIKGTRVRNAAGVQYLADYGGLLTLKINATDFVEFTYNGVTLTTDGVNDIGDGEAFTIICGRDGYTLYVRLVVGANDQTKSQTSSSLDPPRYDFARERDLYIGAQEDPAGGSRFVGDVDVVGFWPVSHTTEPPNAEGALFYFSFADQIDSSIRGAVGAAVTHSDKSGPPDYAPCAIQDSPYKAILAGLPVPESGPSGFTGGIAGIFSSDAVCTRFGDLAVACSNGRAAIFDLAKSVMAPFGVPEIGERVAVGSLGSGTLVGARGYAIRLLASNGSYGPWNRLQPILLDNEKAILGSSSQTGDDLESELGETYGRTIVGGESRFRFPFAAGAPADGTYPIEIEARVPEMDEDVKEGIFARGAERVNGTANSPAMFDSGIAASFDPNSNWSAQRAFRYKAPVATVFREAFGIFGFGKADPGKQNAYNADFVAYITNEGWGSARPRLIVAVARTANRVSWVNAAWFLHANYKLCAFTNDDISVVDGGDFWRADHDYNVVMQREGGALKVYVHNRTLDNWTTLTARSMTGLPSAAVGGSAGTVPATSNPYSADDLFTGMKPFSDTRNIWLGSANFNSIEVADISGAGAVDTGNYYDDLIAGTWSANNGLVRGQPGTTIHYHSRFWGRSYPLSTIKLYSEERWAAQDSGPLEPDCIVDVAHIVEDFTSQPSSFFDKAGQTLFTCLDASGSACAFKGYNQTGSYRPQNAPLLLLGADGTAISTIPLALYFTELGDGQLVLRVGTEGAFVITEKLWSEVGSNPAYVQVRESLPFINNWTEFKRIAFGLNMVTAGGVTTFTVLGMSVNATTIFPRAIGGATTMATGAYAGGWIHVAGLATTGNAEYEVHVSDLRLWALGFGPDVQKGTGFLYQSGRVDPDDLSDLLVYAKFQPRDEYNGGAGLASAANRLYDYGTLGGATNEWRLLGANDTYRAMIFDTRVDDANVDDPQPLVSFPSNPRHDIVAIEIAATKLVPVVDFDSSDETQEALNAARIGPLFQLGTVPIGATHYIDNAVDSALGFEVDEREGYQPPAIRQILPWQDHLCAIGDEGDLWVSSPGPGGFASFPSNLRWPVSFGDEPDTLVAGAALNDAVVLFGKGCTLIVGGAPTAPRIGFLSRLGGAYSPRCVASDGRSIYAFNGRLWRVGMGEGGAGVQDFGLPVDDLLPSAANARLEFSETLGSLLLINESTGVVLRFSFRRGEWFVEDRDAAAMGERVGGYGLVTRHGAYAQDSTTVYADDVDSNTPTSLAGTKASNDVTVGSTTGLQVGQRHAVKGGTVYISARVTAIVGLVVTFDSLAGISNGAVTLYPGAGSEGFMLDTGDVRHPMERGFLDSIVVSIQAGTAELGVDGYSVAGDRVSRADLVWDTMSDGSNGVGRSGTFLRAAVRSIEPVAVKLSSLEAILLP